MRRWPFAWWWGLAVLLLASPTFAQSWIYSSAAERVIENLLLRSPVRCCKITDIYNAAGSVHWTFPTADGTSGQAIITNGSGVLSFGTATGSAPVGATYVTLTTNATLTNERVLTGTASQVTITDNGAGSTVVVSLPATINVNTSGNAATATTATDTAAKTGTGSTYVTNTAPSIAGGTHTALTSLGIRSTGAAFDLTFASTEVLTTGRTLTLKVNNANRTLDLAGNVSLAGAFTTSGSFDATFTLTGTTNVILPVSGTLLANARAINTTSPITGGGDLSVDRTIACATCGVTGSPLSQFAATNSAQFFGVISDETGGAGVIVGNASPVFTTNITTPAIILNPTTDATIVTNTSDGSDNKSVQLNGGGAMDPSRGAEMYLFGNEYAAVGGQAYLDGGNVVGGGVFFRGNGSNADMSVGRAGGVILGAPTGSFKGVGTLNAAGAYYANGTVGCTGVGTASTNGLNTTCTSDARLKDLLGSYAGGLDVLREIQPVRFRWNALQPGEDRARTHIGFTAQNVRGAIPESAWLVKQADGGEWYTLEDRALTATLVNSVKELVARVEALEARTRTGYVEFTETVTGRR